MGEREGHGNARKRGQGSEGYRRRGGTAKQVVSGGEGDASMTREIIGCQGGRRNRRFEGERTVKTEL